MKWGAWYITHHALDRWCDRYEPTASRNDALERLTRFSADALDTEITTPGGHHLYLHPDAPEARFVVAHNEAGGRTSGRTLVTVIDAPRHRARLSKPSGRRGRVS